DHGGADDSRTSTSKLGPSFAQGSDRPLIWLSPRWATNSQDRIRRRRRAISSDPEPGGLQITSPVAVGPCVACAPSGRPQCRPPASLCSWVWENRAGDRAVPLRI